MTDPNSPRTAVSALFVDPNGPYPRLLLDTWAEGRDARAYANSGPNNPVVCHPPCQLWTNFAAVNYKRYGKDIPAWYPGGGDDRFWYALQAVRRFGGVLEHPAFSHAWPHYGLERPRKGGGWAQYGFPGTYPPQPYWVCEVYQSAYGHKARKKTWLLYSSPMENPKAPFELNWERKPGTHQCGWFDRNKPTLGKAEASRTPMPFAVELIRLAQWSRE